MTLCNVKEVTHKVILSSMERLSDEGTENYHLTLQLIACISQHALLIFCSRFLNLEKCFQPQQVAVLS